MLTELTFAILKYGFLVLLWIFVACTVRSLYRDVETLSPRKSRAHRRKERRARKAVEAPAPVAARPHQSSAPHQAPNPPCWSSSMAPAGESSRCFRQHHHAWPFRFEHRGSGRRIRLVPPCRALYGSRPPASGPSKTWVPPRHCGQPAASERSDDSRIARSRTHWRNHLELR